VLFVTFPFAGDLWLQRRLQAISQAGSDLSVNVMESLTAYSKYGSITQLKCSGDTSLVGLDHPSIICVVRNPLAMLADAQGVQHAMRNASIDMMVDFVLHSSTDKHVVRLEDFAAFPVVTLRKLCELTGVPCSIELIRAFLNADRPVRRRSKLEQISRFTSIAETFDMFSWVDRLPARTAVECGEHYSTFCELYYPEVHRFCNTQEPAHHAS
jgi:hypothetical protein